MQADGFSLRRRITVLAVVLLLSAALILVVFIRDYAERASDRAFDRLLAASALTIAGAVQIEDGAVTLELPYASFAMFSGNDRIFYAVRAPDGQLVTGYGDLASTMPLATSLEAEFDDVDYGGETVRVASIGRLVSTAQSTGWVTIRVAETQGARNALSREIISNAIVPLIALTVLAGWLVWYLIRRSFAPLLALEQELRARAQDDLSAVDIPVPAEVRHLVNALNDFMARLQGSMERLSELVTEAAHQVRTPLASLRAQAEVAMDENDPVALRERIGRIHQGAVQSSQLVSQLLMDATISHRLELRDAQTTTLGSLVDEVVQRLDPDALLRLSVSMDDEIARQSLPYDRISLREMLRNLVDNALAYSHDAVDIVVARREGTETVSDLYLAVLDRGPGIAPDERDKVLERFGRGRSGEGKPGSGLGLSIVKRVVDAHRGRLSLSAREGGGLAAEVHLPFGASPQSAPDPQRRGSRLGAAAVLLALGACFIDPAYADPVHYPAASGGNGAQTLTIVGTTDTQIFSIFVAAFQDANPGIAVSYEETETLPMYEDYLTGRLQPAPDLLISSASDLQVKLANDGHAVAHRSDEVAALPRWAQWRDEVFGFTFEPAVIIYNPDLVSGDEAPRTHLELAEVLEADPERFRGRVATYDIAASGVGYLLAVQDQLISSQFWRLANAFGRTDAVLSGSSPDILSRVASGELAIAYNVLGSYAFARQAAGANIGIVVPDDYVLVLTRSMLIPRDAPSPGLAGTFVDFALSRQGQAVAAGPTALGAVMPDVRGMFTTRNITELGSGAVQPIALGPALMVALDQQRKSRFLETWRGIVSPRR
ncbi:extracellular solute-binding protein [Pararhizobium haloflavum]|uniref:extracellular solute-binding protein n=1 Tax=Pararhizobium haloflavum TaxID=2037914 RepID=UPI000C19C29A|nr:extracellular solute-binding protein [Pararhizobium haloflavum]